MHYELTGHGKHTFVLLHNAGGSHCFFEPQIQMLQNFGQVLSIDLPGHGASPTDQSQTINTYAKIIKVLCGILDLNNIIGIGLNYGADIFLEINSLFPDLLSGLVMIDPPIFLSEKVKKLINHNITHLESISSAEHASELVQQSFIKASDHAKKIATEAFLFIDGKFLADIYRDLLIWDKKSKSKVKILSIPCLTILTDAALCSITDLTLCNDTIKTAKVVGSLYWATLEVPAQINSMIERFMEIEFS